MRPWRARRPRCGARRPSWNACWRPGWSASPSPACRSVRARKRPSNRCAGRWAIPRRRVSSGRSRGFPARTATCTSRNPPICNSGTRTWRGRAATSWLGLDAARAVVGVRVVTGAIRALTAKHQARLRLGPRSTELVTPRDTASLAPLAQGAADLDAAARPLHAPAGVPLWPIARLYARLRPLVGRQFTHVGPNQERRAPAPLGLRAAGVSHGGGRRAVSRHPPSAGRGQAANRPHHRSGPGAAGRPGVVAGSRAGRAGRPPLRRALRPVLRAHGR